MPEEPKRLYQRDWYGKALIELGGKNSEVVVLTADLGDSTRASQFKKSFPDRYFNFGVAEANMIGASAGFAASGKHPFVSTFAVFATGKAWEQVRQVLAYPNLPVRIVATHAGLTVGEDGASHQTLEDISNMRVLPNMSVIVPADAYETYAALMALESNESYLPGPVYVRLSRAAFPVIYKENVSFRLGCADILREGDDVAIFAIGLMVSKALKAADILEKEHSIQATVVNVSSIKPLDVETITGVIQKTGACVTAEEHQVTGGLGSAIAEVAGEFCPAPIHRVGVQDAFGQSGSADELIDYYGLTAEAIVTESLAVTKKK